MNLITEEQFAESILTNLLEVLIPFPNALEKMKWEKIAKVGNGLRRINRNILQSLENHNIMNTGYSRMKLASQVMYMYSLSHSDKQLLSLRDPRIKDQSPSLARFLVKDIETSLKMNFVNQDRPACYMVESENYVCSTPLTWKIPLSGDGGILDEILCSPAASCIGIAIAAMNSIELGCNPDSNFIWWPSNSLYDIRGDETWKHPEIWEESNEEEGKENFSKSLTGSCFCYAV